MDWLPKLINKLLKKRKALVKVDDVARQMAENTVEHCLRQCVVYERGAVSECLERYACMGFERFREWVEGYTGFSISDSTAIEIMKRYQRIVGKCIKRFDNEEELLSELRRAASAAIYECDKMLRLVIMKPLADIVGHELLLSLHLSKVLENMYCSDLKPEEVKRRLHELIEAAKQVLTTCKMVQE
jgi:hypothetical protein